MSYYAEILAAGERLLAAQRAEAGCARAYGKQSTAGNRANWMQARVAVDAHGESYLDALRFLQSN